MQVIELGPGQENSLPRAVLRAKVTSSTRTGVVLDVVPPGAGQRMSEIELAIPPQDPITLIVRPKNGSSFDEQAKVGLAIELMSNDPQVSGTRILIAESEVGGLTSVQLAQTELSGDGGRIRATGPQPVPEWMRPGLAALAASQVPPNEWVRTSSWALVMDGSASMLRMQQDGELSALLALVCGVMYQTGGGLPRHAVMTSAVTDRDITGLLGNDTLDGAPLIDQAPAAWGVLAPSVARLVGLADTIVAVTDGVPPDIDELAAVAGQSGRFVLVTAGRSATGVSPDPVAAEELSALAELGRRPGVSVIALPRSGRPAPVIDLTPPARAGFAAALVRPGVPR